MNEIKNVYRATVSVIIPTEFSRMMETYKVPTLNTDRDGRKEIGQALAKGEYFSIIWNALSDGSVYVSLHSNDSGINVGKIAENLGEGGNGDAFNATTSFSSLSSMLENIKI